MPNIVVIDHYDSFTYNLKHSLEICGAVVSVHLYDDPFLKQVVGQADALVISPGPSHPSRANQTKNALMDSLTHKPVLGVCLGMQILNEMSGGSTKAAPFPVHGKPSKIKQIEQSAIFQNISDPFTAARYHSLVCDRIGQDLKITAESEQIIMAFEHKDYPLFGVQFHPESFLTPDGQQIIANFVDLIR